MTNTKINEGSVVVNKNNESGKVRLRSIANYLKKKTGIGYSVHYGNEYNENSEVTGECAMIIPDSYNVKSCKVVTDIENDEFDFIALNEQGVNVYDDNVVFLWSFDMYSDNDGYYVSVDGVKNGVLTLDMLPKKYGYLDSEVLEIQNC